MEKANALKHFPCTLHPQETVRKVDFRNDGVHVYCLECLIDLDKATTQHLLNIDDYPTEYLKVQSKVKDISEAFDLVPKDVEETLAREKEIKEKLAAHIENEKRKVIEAKEILKKRFHDELEKTRAEGHKLYDAELTRLNENFEVLHDTVNAYKPGDKVADTMESMVGQINSLENTNNLADFLTHIKNYTETYEETSSCSQEERAEAVQTVLKNMCKDISGLLDKKPTTLYGKSRSKHEDVAKNWETSVPVLQSDLDVHIMNRVPNLTLHKASMDSKILQDTELDMLVKWLEGRKEFELLYRGSEHGYSATDFRQKCDGKGPTVVLIQSSTGQRFGGYAEVSWGTYSSDSYNYSTGSFLFSLDLKEKLECITPSHSLYSDPGYGPCWGRGDLVLIWYFKGDEDLCGDRRTTYCSSELGNCYRKLSTGQYLTGDSYNFIVEEIEVYAVKG